MHIQKAEVALCQHVKGRLTRLKRLNEHLSSLAPREWVRRRNTLRYGRKVVVKAA